MYRKRERTQNWSLEEKLYLLELVKSRLDVLENKRIDSASSAMKGLAWQDIHAGFASRFGSDRDAHRVREQWRRMKGQSRTEMLEFAERVRTYGAEVANQRRPSALAEEVWRTLELARRLNAFHQQSFGTGDDLGSPVNLDDDEDDTEDVMDTDGCHPAGSVGDMRNLNGFSSSRHEMAADLLLEAGRRSDRVSEEDPSAPGHGQHDGDRDDASDAERQDGAAVTDRRHNSSAPGLMSMLRPKVELELNDVPELDTSMVPSGLSITAVKLGGGTPVSGMGHSSAKRRALERAEASVRSWGSPSVATSGLPTHLPSAAPTSTLSPAGVVPTPGASLLECKRMEHRRRLEMMEEEHQAKMELLRLEKDTAKVRRRIATAEEAAALSYTACRACGAVMRNGERDSAAVKRPAVSTSGCPDQEQDGDGDASSVVSRGSSSALGSGPGPGPGSLLNGAREEDDDNNSQDDQVRFVGGLGSGDPGSGAGKGGGSGGAIRDAGGAFGKMEAAHEEEYFYKQQREQLKKLKEDLTDEISFHEEQIKRHQEAITRHKQRVENLDKK